MFIVGLVSLLVAASRRVAVPRGKCTLGHPHLVTLPDVDWLDGK